MADLKMNVKLSDVVGKKALRTATQFAVSPKKAVQNILFTLDRLIRNTFQEQRDPWNKSWKPLKGETLKARRNRKSRPSDSTAILVDTADMFRSFERVATEDEGYLSIGTDDRPVTPHQFGDESINLAARPMMPILPEGVSMSNEWEAEIWKEIDKSIPQEFKKQ